MYIKVVFFSTQETQIMNKYEYKKEEFSSKKECSQLYSCGHLQKNLKNQSLADIINQMAKLIDSRVRRGFTYIERCKREHFSLFKKRLTLVSFHKIITKDKGIQKPIKQWHNIRKGCIRHINRIFFKNYGVKDVQTEHQIKQIMGDKSQIKLLTHIKQDLKSFRHIMIKRSRNKKMKRLKGVRGSIQIFYLIKYWELLKKNVKKFLKDAKQKMLNNNKTTTIQDVPLIEMEAGSEPRIEMEAGSEPRREMEVGSEPSIGDYFGTPKRKNNFYVDRSSQEYN